MKQKFILSNKSDLASSGVVNILGITPADGTLIELFPYLIDTYGSDVQVEVFEGTTVSANGTAADLTNKNRLTPVVAKTQTFTGPTVTSDGTLIATFSVSATASSKDIRDSFILQADTNYLIRITNGDSANGATVFTNIIVEENG